ncbi:MAG: Trm112 family protein [Gammaproteobacteria bacterium]|nr:Trm112 family protein [Gammaproteobacteria bacterium]
MSIDGKLLEILCCPVTKSPVIKLTASQLKNLNEEISKGEVHLVSGEVITEPLQEGLITESSKTIYRVDDGIPVMLEEQGINTDQFPDGVI